MGWARGRFWLLPALCAVFAGAAGLGLPEVDGTLLRSRSLPFLFGGGPEGARALLSAMISSMITFTALCTTCSGGSSAGRSRPALLSGLLREVHAAAQPEHRPLIARKLAGWGEQPPGSGLDLAPSDLGLRDA